MVRNSSASFKVQTTRVSFQLKVWFCQIMDYTVIFYSFLWLKFKLFLHSPAKSSLGCVRAKSLMSSWLGREMEGRQPEIMHLPYPVINKCFIDVDVPWGILLWWFWFGTHSKVLIWHKSCLMFLCSFSSSFFFLFFFKKINKF